MTDERQKGISRKWRTGTAWAVLTLVVLGGWQGGGDQADCSPAFAFAPVQLRDHGHGAEKGGGIRLHALSTDTLTIGGESPLDMVSELYVGERKAWEGGGVSFYRRTSADDDDKKRERGGLFSDRDEEEVDFFSDLFKDKRTERDSGRGWLSDQIRAEERRERSSQRRETFMRENMDWGGGRSRDWGLNRIDAPSAGFDKRMSPFSNSEYGSGQPNAVGAGVSVYDRLR